MTKGEAIKASGKAASGLGRSWSNWQSSASREEELLQRERNSLFSADQTKRRTAYEAWRNDVYARRVIGSQRQSLATSGVDLSGTAIDDLVATMQELTLEKVVGISEGQTEEAMQRAEALDAKKAAKKEHKNRFLNLGMDWVSTGMDIAGVFV